MFLAQEKNSHEKKFAITLEGKSIIPFPVHRHHFPSEKKRKMKNERKNERKGLKNWSNRSNKKKIPSKRGKKRINCFETMKSIRFHHVIIIV